MMNKDPKTPKGSFDYHEVLAVIPTLGTDIKRLNEAIRSLRKYSADHKYHLVIVDNSRDGNLEGVDEVDEILRYGINLGWVGALEIVRRSFQFRYLWTVQDDMVFLNDVLGILKADLDSEPKRGVSSPIIVKDGMVPRFSFCQVMDDQDSLTWSGFPKAPAPVGTIEIPPNICAVLGRGSLWRGSALSAANGFGLNLFPVLNVDTDMCLRIVREGWSIKPLKDARVEHRSHQSTTSFLRGVLRSQNMKLVRQNYFERTTHRNVDNLEIDHEFLFAIAKKSTYLVLDASQQNPRPFLMAFLSTRSYLKAYERYVGLLSSNNAFVKKSAQLIGNCLKSILRISKRTK